MYIQKKSNWKMKKYSEINVTTLKVSLVTMNLQLLSHFQPTAEASTTLITLTETSSKHSLYDVFLGLITR